jgi:hypothetical protein
LPIGNRIGKAPDGAGTRGGECTITEKPRHRFGKRGDVARLHQEPVHAIRHGFSECAEA